MGAVISARRERQVQVMREMRERYDDDDFDRGDRATLRRCRTVAEVELEGAFWHLVASAARKLGVLDRERGCEPLAIAVLAYPSAAHAELRASFRLGTYLREQLVTGDEGGATLRFRQLLAARDPDDLARRLRQVLKLAGAAVDWGELGADLIEWCASDEKRERVLRRWAQDFYAVLDEERDDAGEAGGARDGKTTDDDARTIP